MVFVLLHRPGSIITDYEISLIDSGTNVFNLTSANEQLSKKLRIKGIPVALSAFSESGKGR